MQYHRPTTLDEVWRLRGEEPRARYIAGGTDLMVRLRESRDWPPALISLRRVDALRAIAVGEPTRIGALASVSDLLEHAGLAESYPVIGMAARRLGSRQIRNAATVGGNLCNASPCADLAPPLLVHEARVLVESPKGRRELSLEDFFVAPGETRLSSSEVLTAILVDPPPDGARATFSKKTRVRMDIAVASVAVLLVLDGTRCLRARVAAGSVAPRPVRLRRVEGHLEGSILDAAAIQEARAIAENDVAPINDVRGSAEYRRHVVGVFVQRALEGLS